MSASLAALALVSQTSSAGGDSPLPDETLFVNGVIYVDADRKVSNLLIRDGIVSGHDVDPAAFARAKVVDLQGAAAYPGFNDSHVHLVSMAVAQSILAPTPGETDPHRIAEQVGAHCKKVTKGTPVMGYGFVLENYDAWYLADLARLDAATGEDCPVMIADQLGHSYIVNSAAMRISGLDGSTKNPPGGKIVKENGRPTGMLRETAGALVGNIAIFPLVPDSSVKPKVAALFNTWTSWLNRLNNNGLNAVRTDDSAGEQFNIYRIVDKSEQLGRDVHYHVGGDLAIDAVLSAIEAAQIRYGRLRGRHTLYHLGLITDEQIARMKRLGVVAGVQPSLHWEAQKAQTAFYYGDHAAGSYPYQKMRDAGITLAFSTDFASNSIDLSWPTEIMRVALTGAGDPVANPPLTMRDLIEGFTAGGYSTTRETNLGKLHTGYQADIVVYEKDLYSVPPEELSKDNPRVLSTWIAGKQVRF